MTSRHSVNNLPTSINSSMANKKEIHDKLLEQMPEGASHEPCSYCLMSTESPEGGTRVDKTYTEEDLQTAVAEATAELAAKVAAMESAAQESEVAAAISAVKAEAAAEIEELRSNLDNAVLAAQAAKNELDTYKADIEAIAAAETLATEVAARREERLAQVKEAASFPDEYLEANADRYAAMSDEDFAERLQEFAAISPAKSGDDKIPSTTALTAARDETNDKSGMGLIKEVMRGTLTGTDLRNL